MKKRIFSIIAAACMLLMTAGCQSGGSESSIAGTPSQSVSDESTSVETSSEVSSSNSESPSEQPEVSEESENTVQQIKVSDMFTAPGRRIWYKVYHQYNPGKPVSYNDYIEAAYVVEDGKVTGYDFASVRNYGEIKYDHPEFYNFEHLDSMTDDEIIETVENLSNPEFLYEVLNNDPDFHYPLSYYEDRAEKQECSISFFYKPDSTGNHLKSEAIQIEPKQKSSIKFPDIPIQSGISQFVPLSTVLSKQYFGIEFDNNYLLVTEYNYDRPTEIILNEAGDEGLIRD